MQVGYILIFIGSFIRASFQLACIQCTSPVRPVSQLWEHSCLDGTLPPVLCEQLVLVNESTVPFKNCISALYTLTMRGNKSKNLDL